MSLPHDIDNQWNPVVSDQPWNVKLLKKTLKLKKQTHQPCWTSWTSGSTLADTHHTSSLRSQLFYSPKYLIAVRFGNPKLCSHLDQICPKWESEHFRDEDGSSRCHNTTARNQHHLQPKCDHHLFVKRQFCRWNNSWRSHSPQVASVDLVDSGFSLWNP